MSFDLRLCGSFANFGSLRETRVVSCEAAKFAEEEQSKKKKQGSIPKNQKNSLQIPR